jgi:hypothetical protein
MQIRHRVLATRCTAVDSSRPRDPDHLPLPYDVALPATSPPALTPPGFERIEGTDYAQSWLVTQA